MSLNRGHRRWILLAVMITIMIGTGLGFLWKNSVSASGASNPERIAFLEKYGWEVEETPVVSGKVRIPYEFGDVYKNYNQIQRKQGFDLQPFAGKEVERYQYIVKNYPNYSGKVYANLLIFEGEIIGGDISSIKLDGFMHGIIEKS
ncbi:MAG: DUF4830 domain-containing protein [Candidatus Merdivicinus sp.]|jgi:hypothetical protein